ncbi:cell surface protein SprA [Gracilimonas mengyeensis]|uniref:T9SS outer membrane translocon Sov/SprA n=1 Tax=Gracilimonas mengyeensis TaxID=1302730 RepID=UPI001FEC78DC|nr:cell surface protein SprA [Gracilimonas mengyeensis]
MRFLYILPLLYLAGNAAGVDLIYAQETADTLNTVSEPDSVLADSTLEGFRFIFRAPKNEYTLPDVINPSGLYSIRPSNDQVVTEWDSANTYTQQHIINGVEVGPPRIYNFDEYAQEKRREQEKLIRRQLVQEGRREEQEGGGLLDFSLQIPGGESSVFSTIFGKPEVNLRVNGSANMNVGASIQNIDNPNLPPESQRRVDPTFNQNLQLNIQGTIGDKLTIATDWDTERAFDFQNRLSIVYEGYEDEIIKSIELGNVSMETGNSLISGGASLFGIKSVAELGNLKLTTVVSQQKGESNTQTITGGSEEIEFQLSPLDYQDNRHFFIDFFNRQVFEDNMSNPQQTTTAYQIADLKVFIAEPQINTTSDDAFKAAAFVDLGVVPTENGYGLPHPDRDTINQDSLDENRDNTSASASDFGVSGNDFYNGYFRPLQAGVDYTVDLTLGIISLNRSLSSGSYLAVSFIREPRPGEAGGPVQIGDISSRSTGLTYLKLLRGNNPTPEQSTWPLTLRNVYSLGVTNLSQENTQMEINYIQGNVPSTTLEGRNENLLAELGLDRLNSQGGAESDNQLDFSNSRTLDAISGTIMFPYLEPFGSRIAELLEQSGASDSLISKLSFTELYNEKQSTARLSEKSNYYEIAGLVKGGVSGNFNLGFSLVEGSVKVFANGNELIEGTDYQVDYSFGSITILNEQYLAPGQEISVEFENNQLNVVGQKNFTGVRAEYAVTDDISVGGTFFKLKEQPLSDKIRIGNESINNTVLGVDANADFDAPWMTRFIDQIPLLQTKAPSNVSFSGEFAQLRPGVSQTNAVRDAIDRGDLYKDEENGLAFIDDFEGSELSISLSSPTRWNLAAAPAVVPGYEPDEAFFENSNITPVNSLGSKIARSDLRSQFAWYTIPRNVDELTGASRNTPESRLVNTRDVFPGRETNNADEQIINTLDVYYNPQERGQYNYNENLKENLEQNPQNQWGGMTTSLPSGQEDLTQSNIEFIEFWVQPLLPGAREPTAEDLEAYDGKIYIEIGVISEDVVPNFSLNSEDGLENVLDDLILDNFTEDPRSYIPENRPAPQGQFSNNDREYADVGLDGVPSENGYDPNKQEDALFSDFLAAMRNAYGEGAPEYDRIVRDPSNDDYVYYGSDLVNDLPLQERFYRYQGFYEGNTPVAGGDNRGSTDRPDTEGLVSRSTVERNNNYYQYELDINPADFSSLEIGSPGTYIVDKVPGGSQQQRWHLVRIPLNEFARKIGDIQGFQNITHVRMWMSGYEKPFTLRFASFEFIGSQWRKVENISETRDATGEFRTTTINIEENANREPVPYRQPEGSIRAQDRGSQINTLANEQSLVLQIENLGPQQLRMVKRVYPGGQDLLNYSNLRMFVHGEGFNERGEAELVVRLGTDLESNYYEYRQPVTPSDPNYPYSNYQPDGGSNLADDAQEVWLYEENSMNIVLSAFNELKQIRNDRQEIDPTEKFEMVLDPEEYDSAPGAVIAIKGNPSLSKINEIGMGVLNPFDPSDVNSTGTNSLNAEFWLNELRVSGFDNEKGWKANAKANFKFADFATLNTNFSRTTTGFGSLDSRLGTRQRSDDLAYDINSTVNLHKLIPDRFGWNFPVSVSTRKNISTPQYLPNQGDTRLSEFNSAIRNRDDLSQSEKDALIEEKLNEVETIRDNFSLNVSNFSKDNSKSKLMQYTVDNTRLNFVYNQGYAKNPQYQFQDNWSFNSSIQYNLSFNNVSVVRPLTFLDDIPVLEVFSDLGLGYMPTSVNASASMSRSYDESRRRVQQVDSEGNPQLQPLQQQHTFNQKSSFGVNYNLTPSIPLSFNSNTNFDLSDAGIRNSNKTGIDSSSFSIVPTFDVIDGLLTDTLSARRSSYDESYSASWRPPLRNISGLEWLSYSASYGGGFNWTNSGRGSGLGATVSNSFRLDHTLKFATGDLFEKIGFIRRMQERDEAAADQRSKNSNAEEGESLSLADHAKYYGRKLFLGLFSFNSIDLAYKTNKTSNQAGYRGDSQLYYAFASQGEGNFSPPLGYRLGLSEEVPRTQLIQQGPFGQTVNLPKVNNYSDNLSLGTRLVLFEDISIDLDWSTQWSERQRDNISLNSAGEFGSTVSSSGEINSSVWAFGMGYEDLFHRQLQAAFDDINGNEIIDESGNDDGRTVLNRNTLQEDFRHAYLGSNTGGVGERGYTPFPKPNWRITWSGIEDLLPFIGDMMNRATLTHQYSGSYRLGWSLNTLTGQQSPLTLGNYRVTDYKDRYEPSTINVERNFSPLLQLNITWQSSLRTQIGFDRSKITSLAMSSKKVTESTTQGINVSINYAFKNLKIPFFPEIRNNIDVTLTGGLADDKDETFDLSRDLSDALSGDPDNIITDPNQYEINKPQITGQKRLNASLVLGYRFSQTVSSNFEYKYTQIDPRSSGYFARRNHEIRFNFRIAIQSR